jgi:hypothetical protein
MMYLEVLPWLFVYLFGMGIAAVLARRIRSGKTLSTYLWRGMVGSLLGVLVADLGLWSIVAGIGGYLTYLDPSDVVHGTFHLPAALEIILRPIPVALVGGLAGLAAGLLWARSTGNRPPEGQAAGAQTA